MNGSADVAVIDGRTVLVVDAAAAGAVAALLDAALSARYRLGLPPVPVAHDVRAAARAAHALAILGVVPVAEPQLSPSTVDTGVWMTTEQAAEMFHIGRRAVVKRIAAGALPARRIGGRWLVRVEARKSV